MATIYDVAKRAGVTAATVSHVINGTRFVREETRNRVLAVIAELNYQPNQLARSLRQRKSYTLGLVVPANTNPFFAEIAKAIEDASFQQGYSLILCNSERDLEKENSYLNILLERQVDGIILVPTGASTQNTTAVLKRRKPIVLLDRELTDVEVDTVLADHRGGAYQAVQHLIELGHRRIACICGPSELAPSAERVAGYRQALSDSGLAEDGLLVEGDFEPASGYRAIDTLLSQPDPPTAIFACNDMMAIGAMARAIELDYRIPDDLSIVGFDDIELAAYTNPKLTTVSLPKYQLGALAIEILLGQLESSPSLSRREVLATSLVVRASTNQHND